MLWHCRQIQRESAARLVCVCLMALNLSGEPIIIAEYQTIVQLWYTPKCFFHVVACSFDDVINVCTGNYFLLNSNDTQIFCVFEKKKWCDKLSCKIFCSKGIESVVGKENLGSDVMCSACEMAVVWIENQLRENKTKELILQYANQVTKLMMIYCGFSFCHLFIII